MWFHNILDNDGLLKKIILFELKSIHVELQETLVSMNYDSMYKTSYLLIASKYHLYFYFWLIQITSFD